MKTKTRTPDGVTKSVTLILDKKKNEKGKWKSQIPTVEILTETYGETLPAGKIDDYLNNLKSEAKIRFVDANRILLKKNLPELEDPTVPAFSNCNGAWTEYGYAIYAWNVLAEINGFKKNKGEDIIYLYVKLPGRHNEDTEWINLFQKDIYEAIRNYEETKSKAITNRGDPNFQRKFNFYSSNPDAVILKFKNSVFEKYWENEEHCINPFAKVENITPGAIEEIDKSFALFKNSVLPSENLQCFISLKNSVRPDRRYQWIHEGQYIKTILQICAPQTENRKKDIVNYKLLNWKYFAIAFSDVGRADKGAMDTGLHVPDYFTNKPVWAVDRLFECENFEQIEGEIRQMIRA